MSDLSLREYFGERIDFIRVMELKSDDGGVDYVIRIDGTYFGDLGDLGVEGMLDYHAKYFRDVLKAEGLDVDA